LDVAEKVVAEHGEGTKLNLGDAKLLLEEAIDGNRYTDIERATMDYIKANYTFTASALTFLDRELKAWEDKHSKRAAKKEHKGAETYCDCKKPSDNRFMIACDAMKDGCLEWYHGDCVGVNEKKVPHVWNCAHCIDKNPELNMSKSASNYYRIIKGEKYDKGMMEAAENAIKTNGQITKDDCKKLFEEIIDGNRYTEIEKTTMKHIRDNFKFAAGADEWLRSEISKWASSHKKRDPREPKKKTSKKAKKTRKKDEEDEDDEEEDEPAANGAKKASAKMDEAEDGEEEEEE